MADAVLAELIRRVAAEHGGGPALTFPGGSIGYRDLDERSSRVANALAASGVAAGDRVALLARNGPVFFEVLFGAAKRNAVPAALNWRLSPVELGKTLDDARATVLVVEAEFLESVRALERLARTLELPCSTDP